MPNLAKGRKTPLREAFFGRWVQFIEGSKGSLSVRIDKDWQARPINTIFVIKGMGRCDVEPVDLTHGPHI